MERWHGTFSDQGAPGGAIRHHLSGSSPRSVAAATSPGGSYDWRGVSRSVPSPSPMSWSTSAKVISPITPLGNYFYDGDPWLRQRLEWDLQYQPVHHHFLLTALTHTARRLWSVKARLKTICVREAFLDWRDGILFKRLDGRLKAAAKILKDDLDKHQDQQRTNSLSPGRKWSRVRETFAKKSQTSQHRKVSLNGDTLRTEGDALKKRLHAVATARRAVPGGMKLARSLMRIQRRRLIVSMAHWKDLATTPMEAWLAMTSIREERCSAWRFSSLGATEAELHETLLPDASKELRQRQIRKAELQACRGELLSGARLLTGVLKSVMLRWFSRLHSQTSTHTEGVRDGMRPSITQLSPSPAEHSFSKEYESSPDPERRTGSSMDSSAGIRPSVDAHGEVEPFQYESQKIEQKRSRRSVQYVPAGADQIKRASQTSHQVAIDQKDNRYVVTIDLGKEKRGSMSQALHHAAMELAWQEQQQALDSRSHRGSMKSTGGVSISSRRSNRPKTLQKSLSKSSLPYMSRLKNNRYGDITDDSDSDHVFKFSDGSGGPSSDAEHVVDEKSLRDVEHKASGASSRRSRMATAQSIVPEFDVGSAESEKEKLVHPQPARRDTDHSARSRTSEHRQSGIDRVEAPAAVGARESADNAETTDRRASAVTQPHVSTSSTHVGAIPAQRESDSQLEQRKSTASQKLDSELPKQRESEIQLEQRKSTASQKHESQLEQRKSTSSQQRESSSSQPIGVTDVEVRERSPSKVSHKGGEITLPHESSKTETSSKPERRTSGITVEPGIAPSSSSALLQAASSSRLSSSGKDTGISRPPAEVPPPVTKEEPRTSKTVSAKDAEEEEAEEAGGEDYDYDEGEEEEGAGDIEV